jgi:hypothetical protein
MDDTQEIVYFILYSIGGMFFFPGIKIGNKTTGKSLIASV